MPAPSFGFISSTTEIGHGLKRTATYHDATHTVVIAVGSRDSGWTVEVQSGQYYARAARKHKLEAFHVAYDRLEAIGGPHVPHNTGLVA